MAINTDMLEVVEVKTYLQRVRCPNKDCDTGRLEFDGKERSIDMVHGGPKEFRHLCDTCGIRAWIKEQYPKVRYELVETPNDVLIAEMMEEEDEDGGSNG